MILIKILLFINGLSMFVRTYYDLDWADDSLRNVTWNFRDAIIGFGFIFIAFL
jgi:hypothetical protein